MGKVRTRILGLEEVEQKQKKQQKLRSQEKKVEKKSVADEIAAVVKGEKK